MHIGYVQFAPVLGNFEATWERLEALLAQGVGADLLVLPELCNSGYNFASPAEAFGSAETIADSRFLRRLQDHCRQHGGYVVSGFNERDGDALYNGAVLVGPEGCLGRYRKLHLFRDEKDFFRPGNLGLPVFACGPMRIGMLICFDWVFPEAWRVLALQQADVICHPSNLVLPGLAQRAVPIHALMNRVFIVTANRVGTEGTLTFTGRSLVADPSGQVLAEAPPEGPHVATVPVDLAQARDKQITPRNHLFQDRRPDAYGLLSAVREMTVASAGTR
jgi:predicted amidohydrolase